MSGASPRLFAPFLLAACTGATVPTAPAPAEPVVMVVAPELTAMSHGEQRVFRARPLRGSTPAGVRYQWSVRGRGVLGTALGNTVTYTAPDADGRDSITVQVVDGSGAVVGAGATPVFIVSPIRVRSVHSPSQNTP